jgi:hypothetical protein
MLLAIFCLLLFKSFHEIISNHYLKVLLVLLLLTSGLKMLTEAGVIESTPLVYLCGNTALFLFIPGVYLYLRNNVYNRSMTRNDLAHLLPALGYCASCVLFYLFQQNARLPQADIFNESTSIQRPGFLFFLLFGYGVTGWYFLLVLKILKDRYGLPKKMKS